MLMLLLKAIAFFHLSHNLKRLTLAEYHEQEEIFKLRLGHLKKVCPVPNLFLSIFNLSGGICPPVQYKHKALCLKTICKLLN